jgi:peptide/nickel transport system ATP-binding protein
MNQPLLEVKNLTKVYRIGGLLSGRTVKAIDSVSFQIPSDKPKIVALVGESGSGKSTIAKIILGLLQPTSGEVIYKGRNILEWLKKDKLEYYKEVQPIFQDPYGIYNPFYRVERVLELAVKKFKLASNKEDTRKLILKAMEDIGLRPEDILGRYPHQLSGGERQRLMLVRILLIKPNLIIADEPISMIDVSLRAMFLNYLISFKDKYNISSLFITHDLNVASYVADDILVLCHGRIVEEGPKDEVIKEPLHPYTKLLTSSIPIPDPTKRWKERLDLTSIESFKKLKVEKGCVFFARCPFASEKCRNETPPFLEIKTGRKVACFLYL